MAEDLQVKLEEHRRKKHEADRLKEQTLKALEAGNGGKGHGIFNRSLLNLFAPLTKLLQFVDSS